jgi:branched-chain amino acid transport system substrate-binding protein
MGSRRWRSLALVVPIAALAAIGCGRDDNGNGNGEGARADLERCEEAPNEILIGATLPLSGPGAPYGELFQQSLEIGRDMAQERGGPRIRLSVSDSRAQAGPAVQQMNQMIDADDAPVIVSAYNDPPLAQAEIAQRTRTLLMNGGGNAPGLRGKPYLWNNVATIDQEARHIYEHAKENLDHDRISILAATDYTREDIQTVEREAQEVFGEDNVQLVTFEPTATNVRPQLQQIRSYRPDSIHLLNSGQLTITSAQNASQMNLGIPFLGTSGTLFEPDILEQPSMEDAHASVMAFEASEEFAELAQERTGTEANAFTGNYADIVLVVHEAARDLIDDGYCVNGQALNTVIRERAENEESFEGANGPVQFADDGTTTRELAVLKVEDGEVAPAEEAEEDTEDPPTPTDEESPPGSGEAETEPADR